VKREHFVSFKFRRFIKENLPNSFLVSPDSRAVELDDYIDEIKKQYPRDKNIENKMKSLHKSLPKHSNR